MIRVLVRPGNHSSFQPFITEIEEDGIDAKTCWWWGRRFKSFFVDGRNPEEDLRKLAAKFLHKNERKPVTDDYDYKCKIIFGDKIDPED